MSFSIFGILLIILCLVAFFRYFLEPKKLFLFYFSATVISTIFLDLGYLVQIGNFYVEYNYFFSFLCFASALYLIIHNSLNKKSNGGNNVTIFLLVFFFLLSVAVFRTVFNYNYISTSYDGLNWDDIVYSGKLAIVNAQIDINSFLRIFMLGIVIIVFTQNYNKNALGSISKKIYYLSSIYLALLLLEMLLLNAFGNNGMRGFYYSIFGETPYSIKTPRTTFSFWSPMGIAREPSNLSFTILYILINNIFYLRIACKKRLLNFNIACFMLLTIFSSSFGGILHFVSIAFLFFTGKNKISFRKLMIVISIVIAFAVVVSIAFSSRFDMALDYIRRFSPDSVSYLPVDSTVIRLYSVYNNLYCFIHNPILGTGVGSIYSFSALITMLANFGLVGFIVYFTFYFRSAKKITDCRITIICVIPFLISFSLTGHIGYLIYYEKTFYVFTLVVLIYDIKRRTVYYGEDIRNLSLAYR